MFSAEIEPVKVKKFEGQLLSRQHFHINNVIV